jgi:hypothetical protein
MGRYFSFVLAIWLAIGACCAAFAECPLVAPAYTHGDCCPPDSDSAPQADHCPCCAAVQAPHFDVALPVVLPERFEVSLSTLAANRTFPPCAVDQHHLYLTIRVLRI